MKGPCNSKTQIDDLDSFDLGVVSAGEGLLPGLAQHLLKDVYDSSFMLPPYLGKSTLRKRYQF